MTKDRPTGAEGIRLSILVPVFNEEENLRELYGELRQALAEEGPWEIIFVDDGSTDGSREVLASISEEDPKVRCVMLARNFGQTAAIAAAIDHSRGRILVPIDADLQNPPAEIPRVVARLEDGYDVVSGWRKHRKDNVLTRVIPSKIANGVISLVTGVHLHDYGCTLKAYRREVLANVRLYGEMHRFLPVYAAWQGARVEELPVEHRSRARGKSKYGLGRTMKVLLDLLTVKLLGSYSTKPIYFFGGSGILLMVLGVLTAGYVVFEKIVYDVLQHKMTLILLAIFLFLVGTMLVMLGLLAELIVRTYHESQNKPIYVVAERRNLD